MMSVQFRYDPTNHYHLLWNVNAHRWCGERDRAPWEKIKLTHDWMNSRPVVPWVQWCLYSRMVDAGVVFA